MSASQTVAEQGPSQLISLGTAVRKVFSFPVFLGVLLFAGVFASTYARGTFGADLVSEGDTWWHLATGERILATHHLPVTEPVLVHRQWPALVGVRMARRSNHSRFRTSRRLGGSGDAPARRFRHASAVAVLLRVSAQRKLAGIFRRLHVAAAVDHVFLYSPAAADWLCVSADHADLPRTISQRPTADALDSSLVYFLSG